MQAESQDITDTPSERRQNKLSHRVVDLLLVFLIKLTAPALRIFARSRNQLPRASAVADKAGISVVTRHYYSPLISDTDLIRPLSVARNLPGLRLDLETHREFLSTFNYAHELLEIPSTLLSKTEFCYENGFFGPGDAEIFYDIIRSYKPARIIEIGSGWSSLLARKAILRNQQEHPDYTCLHTCIEPYEAPWLESIGVDVIRQRVEMLEPAFFDQLEEGDILFVDSSHTIRPQGDVIFEIAEIYPRLKPGVLVQIHDIFTPRDYPTRWVVGERRIWGEQYLLEAFLVSNAHYEVVCALNWLANDHKKLLQDACPVLSAGSGAQPGSFWIRRTSKSADF